MGCLQTAVHILSHYRSTSPTRKGISRKIWWIFPPCPWRSVILKRRGMEWYLQLPKRPQASTEGQSLLHEWEASVCLFYGETNISAPDAKVDNIITTTDFRFHARIRGILSNSFTEASLRSQYPLILSKADLLYHSFEFSPTSLKTWGEGVASTWRK